MLGSAKEFGEYYKHKLKNLLVWNSTLNLYHWKLLGITKSETFLHWNLAPDYQDPVNFLEHMLQVEAHLKTIQALLMTKLWMQWNKI